VGLFSGITLIVFATSRSLPLTIAMLALTGLTQSITMSMGQTMINLLVENQLRGRVMAVYMMLWSSTPVVMLPAGVLSDHVGPSTTVLLSGVLVIAFFLVMTRRRGVVRDFSADALRREVPYARAADRASSP
jgi:sugar phosphate permease